MRKVKQVKQGKIVHTRAQKIWGGLALAALFLCGVMVGISFHGYRAKQANKVEVISEQQVEVNSDKTCLIIEDLLLQQLNPINSQDLFAHEYNTGIYEKLIMRGCSENQMRYHKALEQEREIIAALQRPELTQPTCAQIEGLLVAELPMENHDVDDRINRAKIYANLSERGCPENAQKFVELAKHELEIARALEDDMFSESDTIEVVETYKRLNMQAAAEEIFETAKKLTNPAIDFILEVEKIINEQ